MSMRIVIIGGVAGGASAAARARRLDESAEIIVFERSGYISFANCGLPYHIGGDIPERSKLLVQTPESLKARFNIDVRIHSEVINIDTNLKQVTVKNITTGETYTERYDVIVLSPGALPIIPPIANIHNTRTFTLRNIEDLDGIMHQLDTAPISHVTIVGGGFIGLEVAEACIHRHLKVSLLELSPQVMGGIDIEMANFIHQTLKNNGVDLRLNAGLSSIKIEPDQTLELGLSTHQTLHTDLLILAIGVRPDIKLAQQAGLEIGQCGGILVDTQMRTNIPDIYAVGDAVEIRDFLTHSPTIIPLAGPANKQGRLVADVIFGKNHHYTGTQGTAICKVFDLTIASVGWSEKSLIKAKMAYEKIYVHSNSHASYYPNAQLISIKLLFSPESGAILGACVIGKAGVDKRIDVFAVAQRAGMTVYDLEALELSYAPPYGSAKDPVNIAGFVAANILRGDSKGIHYDQLSTLTDNQILLDVRSAAEIENLGKIDNARHIPVDELRARMAELPKDKEIIIYCQIGLRGYVAYRQLVNHGYRARNLIGGFYTWKMANFK